MPTTEDTDVSTRSSFDEGSRVVVHRRRFDDPITADERLETMRTTREDYIDRNGSGAADLVGSKLPFGENEGDARTVAFVSVVMPDGLPVTYGGHVHSEETVLETAIEAASYAEQFAALAGTDIEVHEPDGSTRMVEIGELDGVPGLLDEQGDGPADPEVEEAARSAVPRNYLDSGVGAEIDNLENMEQIFHIIDSTKYKPYGSLYREFDWLWGTNGERSVHGFLTDLSLMSGWQKWDTWYENRYGYIRHFWDKSEADNVELADWGPKGTQVGTVEKKMSVGASVGTGGASMDAGIEWGYKQPDVYDEDKSEPADKETKWLMTVSYNTAPRNSTVNFDPVSLCKMDRVFGRTKIAETWLKGYWTTPMGAAGWIEWGNWKWYLG